MTEERGRSLESLRTEQESQEAKTIKNFIQETTGLFFLPLPKGLSYEHRYHVPDPITKRPLVDVVAIGGARGAMHIDIGLSEGEVMIAANYEPGKESIVSYTDLKTPQILSSEAIVKSREALSKAGFRKKEASV